MKLRSNCKESSEFFLRNKRMFLDSCVVNDIHLKPDVKAIIDRASQKYSTYISAVSMLEIGFGPSSKADINQQNTAIDLYFNHDIEKVNSDTVDKYDPIHSKKSNSKFLYIPQEHEWYGARHKLVTWMDNEQTGGTSARKQANDALIYMCAWNANSFLVTDNVKDFSRFNRIMLKEFGGHLPIFTVSDLKLSVKEEVIFPDNIKNYP